MLAALAALLRINPPVANDAGLLFGSGATVPSAEYGWQPSALFQDTTTGKLYKNEGTLAECSFVEMAALTTAQEALLSAVAGTATANKAVILSAAGTITLPGAIDFSPVVTGTITAGSLVTTGTTWVAFTAAGACGMKLLLENQCDTGEFATLRMRARANNTTVSGNGGNSVGTTTCFDASASAQDHEYGNLKAINACAQPNAKNQTVDATNIVTAIYGRIDATGTSVGRRWVSWIDTHAETKADGGDYLERFSHNGTVAIDGLWTIYGGGRLPLLMNIEDATPGFVTAATGVTTISKALAIKIAGTTYYIPCCTGTT